MQRKWTYRQNLPKRIGAFVIGSKESTCNDDKDPKLVGHTNEVKIDLETTALLDTGSCISAISKSFYDKHLQSVQVKPLSDLLQIECADGNQLPYEGYVEINMTVTRGLPNVTTHTCLFLITPDTRFSFKTPVIIGTNILTELLEECKQNFGDQYLQRANLYTQWYLSFRCISMREKELKKHKNRIAIIKSAETKNIILGPNGLNQKLF
jgi:hypothetical protein